jgi:ABC-2 type transport system ATP-binding protein
VSTTLVTSLDNAALQAALAAKGLHTAPAGSGIRVTAEPVDVGRVAAEQAIVLTDLRAGNEGGLEDLFLELTADTQREPLRSEVSA